MRPSSPHHPGRHELGQNFLHHRPTIDAIVGLVEPTRGAILEIGAGDGALTVPLSRLGRPLTAIELDPRRAHRLSRRLPGVAVRCGDALDGRFDVPVVVGNIPFHLTTPLLRRLLSSGTWGNAVLLMQWEVARKRAGVGGGTLLTAQSAPWFTFALAQRVPARHFSPQPSVDGGVLVIARRPTPLVPARQRRAYEAFASRVFSGRGRGLGQVLTHLVGRRAGDAALGAAGLRRDALPRHVRPEQWAALWGSVQTSSGARSP